MSPKLNETTTQCSTDVHEIPRKSPPIPGREPVGDQLIPPSVVTQTPAPTAKQTSVVGHETAMRLADATVWSVQTDPPSTVRATVSPSTAVQSAVDGHESETRPFCPVGTLWASHVDPPSVVAAIPAPTAVQVELEEQATPLRPATPEGVDWIDQVAPPSVEAMIDSPPTAVQVELVLQLTASRLVTPFGTDAAVHVVPPSDVVEIPPVVATHAVDETQETPEPS